jgi:hypothetical protein
MRPKVSSLWERCADGCRSDTGVAGVYLALDAVLFDDDPRELVSEVLAGAEHGDRSHQR